MKLTKIFGAYALAILFVTTGVQAATIPSSFSKAKKILYTKVYPNHGTTIYSGCNWSKKKIDLSSCRLENSFEKKWHKRALRIEAEHAIPASWILRKDGQYRTCAVSPERGSVSKRKWCSQHDPAYRRATSDLVNLFPSVGAINGKRSAKPYSESLSGRHKQTFNGNLRSTVTSRVFIPPASMRGDLARVAAYMHRHYGVNYSKRQQGVFDKWNKTDPVSNEEMARCEKIRQYQGQCVFD